MTHRAVLRPKWLAVATGVLVMVTSFLGASGTSPSSAASHAATSPTPIATSLLNPDSICGSDQGDNVRQQWNGDYTGCFRVPDFRSSHLLVALQEFAQGDFSSATSEPTTTLDNSTPNLSVKLAVPDTSVTPGEDVVVTGRLNKPLVQTQSAVNLCWDGCGGLDEQGAQLRWLTSKKFEVTLKVPETAWLVANKHGVEVHALSSGRYEVDVQCLGDISGCALRGGVAKVSVRLNAPTPQRCVGARPCETMVIAPKVAEVGDQVLVSGWAPVASVIEDPWGYDLSVTSGSSRTKYPALAYGPSKLNGSFNVVLTPTPMRIGQSPPWARLGTIPYLSSTFSGPSVESPTATSSRVAWCQPTDIVITGGATPSEVPIADVRDALTGSTLKIAARAPAAPSCAAVQLDPTYPNTVYAGFEGEEGNSIPPVYLAPMYTTNHGTSWHVIPIPAGETIEDFGGFTVEGASVEALFMGQEDYSNSPEGTVHGQVVAEVTSNGGQTWSPTTLGCPSDGPCMSFGPYIWGNCNMSNDTQGVLLGSPGATASSGVTWTDSSWVTSVNSCFSQQLVVSSSRDLFLLDPASEYPLLRSTDGGETWSNWSLPPIAAVNYGPDSPPITNSLVLAPDGSLFASISTNATPTQELYRLYPGATSWCEVPDALRAVTAGNMGPLHVDATDLLWTQLSLAGTNAVPFTRLTC